MDAQSEALYESLLDSYTRRIVAFEKRPPFEREIVRMILEEVRDSNLRPDGKLFLLLNMHVMIVIPLLSRQELLPEELKEDVRRDVRKIVIEASTRATSVTGIVPYRFEAASAHQVMRTIDRLWKQLRINRLNVWGADDE